MHRTDAGDLYEPATGRTVDLAVLREDIRAGRHFIARHETTGAECTIDVLLDILTSTLPDTLAWLAAARPAPAPCRLSEAAVPRSHSRPAARGEARGRRQPRPRRANP
ncbi:hypothetical protein [Streptomyces longispororuber]|uniref:hypothetical protein n=1 Tax=Streptomyces longispororuber TaxID=68230 RepID=UPI00167EBCB1|nr:hypothetical protein [Streptomyces longispororuber]